MIDWYTIIFQIINFMVLVFLLRHFLYGPIIRTMDEREEKIMRREEEAAQRQREAIEASQTYQRKTKELQQRTDEIIEKARVDAEEKKRAMLQEARLDVQRTKKLWEQDFERERNIFIRELRRRIGEQACAIARRCLSDLADAHLEELVWAQFLVEMGSFSEESLGRFSDAVVTADYVIALRSVFEIEENRLEELAATLREILPEAGDRIRLIVEGDPDLICGFELESGGHRVGWSIDDYLNGLEARILGEMDEPMTGTEVLGDGGIGE